VHRDVYPGTVADPRIKPVRWLAGKKRRNPQFVTKHMLVRFLYLLHESIDQSEYYNGLHHFVLSTFYCTHC